MNRRPWAAVAVSFVFTPAIGMFYLGKGGLGLLYLVIQVAAFLFSYLAVHLEIWNLDLETTESIVSIALRLIGVPHCFLVSRRLTDKTPAAWFARWYNLAGVFIAAPLLFALGLRVFVFEPFHIPSGAMLPTLRVGDHLFVSKFSYGYTRYSFPFSPEIFEGRIFGRLPERGDIAVFRRPKDDRIDYIKRIIGLPGDKIQVKKGLLHINGAPVRRDRVAERSFERRLGPTSTVTEYVETLPNGRRHLIWEESDAGFYDTTPVYTVPAGHVFAMGDNRDNSQDSRAIQDVGFIPVQNLIGRLSLVVWNSSDEKLLFLGHGRTGATPGP